MSKLCFFNVFSVLRHTERIVLMSKIYMKTQNEQKLTNLVENFAEKTYYFLASSY